MANMPLPHQTMYGTLNCPIKKVLDSKVCVDGQRYYQVKWCKTWESEDTLEKFNKINLIDEFWQFVSRTNSSKPQTRPDYRSSVWCPPGGELKNVRSTFTHRSSPPSRSPGYIDLGATSNRGKKKSGHTTSRYANRAFGRTIEVDTTGNDVIEISSCNQRQHPFLWNLILLPVMTCLTQPIKMLCLQKRLEEGSNEGPDSSVHDSSFMETTTRGNLFDQTTAVLSLEAGDQATTTDVSCDRMSSKGQDMLSSEPVEVLSNDKEDAQLPEHYDIAIKEDSFYDCDTAPFTVAGQLADTSSTNQFTQPSSRMEAGWPVHTHSHHKLLPQTSQMSMLPSPNAFSGTNHRIKMGQIFSKKENMELELPVEVWQRIFDNLSIKDLKNVVLVSRMMNSMASLPNLWRSANIDWENMIMNSEFKNSLESSRLSKIQNIVLKSPPMENYVENVNAILCVAVKLTNLKHLKIGSPTICHSDYFVRTHENYSESVNAILRMAEKLTSLKHLYINGINVSSLPSERLAAVVSRLRSVHLCDTYISKHQADALFAGVVSSKSLVDLNVSVNVFNEVDANVLSKAVSRLRSVDLCVTRLETQQIEALLHAFLQSKTLESLNIACGDYRRVPQDLVEKAKALAPSRKLII